MSTGKRLAKRSILGTRVCAPGPDGRFRPGVIHATKTEADGGRDNLYCVLFEDKSTGEYRSRDLVGPGFQTVTRVRLREGQRIYVTFNGREVPGRVMSHSSQLDEVRLALDHQHQPVELCKRLEEVRLLESRKSARLQDQDTDYSRLADGQTEPRRRAASFSIDVPAINGSCRKRRPSADDDVMDDCMAAMVLMSLSCSPKSPRLPEYGMFSGGESWASSSSGSSSGAQSWSSCQSLPPISSPPDSPQSSGQSDSLHGDPKDFEDGGCSRDEGIDMDEEEDEEEEDEDEEEEEEEEEEGEEANDTFLPRGTRQQMDPALLAVAVSRSKEVNEKFGCKVVFQCTWRGCKLQFDACDEVERHVRSEHLSDSDLTDHEEEFYYTEVEMEQLEASSGQLETPVSPDGSSEGSAVGPGDEVSFNSIYTSSAPTLSHLDMVRPPHEDPEYRRSLMEPVCKDPLPASPINIPHIPASVPWQQHAYAASAPGIMVSPQKLMRLSPKTVSSSLKGSPLHRKGRSESRKCRKIYGMENRDMWCTQCKWKKACTRFQD